MTSVVLDSGALIALERRVDRVMAMISALLGNGTPTYVPAGVLAQVWRGSPRQQPLARLLRDRSVRIEPLSDQIARQIGQLLAAKGTSDVIDGHVAFLARHQGAAVMTSDPKDIQALDPTLQLIIV
jgi:predicted nucleic acid-binding protein